jgi:uncharacterized protein with FMN-binding domain
MRNMMKIVCLLMMLSAVACEESESQKIRKLQLSDVDLSEMEDGRYVGRFTHHDSVYETEVLIKDHHIEDVRVLQSEGDEYDQKALDIIQRVLEKQSLHVDVVTGATKSSKLYLISIYNALSGEDVEIQ